MHSNLLGKCYRKNLEEVDINLNKDNQIPWKDFIDNLKDMGANIILRYTLLLSKYLLDDYLEEDEHYLLCLIVDLTRLVTSSSVLREDVNTIHLISMKLIDQWRIIYSSKGVTWVTHQV